ncbi:MAG: DNA polymerase III subunit delta [Myxococcaceae bacterium]
MPKIYPDWLKQATNPSLPPILAIGGEERAFVDEALVEIKKRVLSSGLTDFNFDVLSAKSNVLESILSAANSLPVMASHRLVLVTESEAIKAEDFTVFEQYLKTPNPSTVLVFVFDQVDTRLKFQKLLDTQAVFYKFDHPKEREMLALIKSRGRLRGLKIDDEAALSLFLEIGNSLLMLDRAFEKLELSTEDSVITTQKISEQVAQTAFQDAFVLARAVVMKDRIQVAKSLCELKKAQEIPLRLLGLLAWQFRIVLKARLLLDEKRMSSEIGSKLNLFGDRLDFVMRAARLLDANAQVNRLKSLLDLDRSLKSSRVPAWLQFDRFVLELIT